MGNTDTFLFRSVNSSSYDATRMEAAEVSEVARRAQHFLCITPAFDLKHIGKRYLPVYNYKHYMQLKQSGDRVNFHL